MSRRTAKVGNGLPAIGRVRAKLAFYARGCEIGVTGRILPGALRRLSRDQSRLIAVVLLAVVALSASGIQSAAAVVTQRTLDVNWRGAYDILVTAKGGIGGSSHRTLSATEQTG